VGGESASVPRFEQGARLNALSDVSDARACESSAARVEEQRFVLSRHPSDPKPGVQGGDGPWPQRAGSLFASLASELDESQADVVKITDIEVENLLDARACVVEKEKERAIPPSADVIDRLEQLHDLILIEIGRLGVLCASSWDLADGAALLEVLRFARGRVTSERLEDSQAMVTSAWRGTSFLHQPVQETANAHGCEHAMVEPVGGASASLGRPTQEELEGISIRRDGVTAGVAFDGEV
jgi:hypothetical protein